MVVELAVAVLARFRVNGLASGTPEPAPVPAPEPEPEPVVPVALLVVMVAEAAAVTGGGTVSAVLRAGPVADAGPGAGDARGPSVADIILPENVVPVSGPFEGNVR